MENQHCPICKKQVQNNPRYPNYVCNDCTSEAEDVEGHSIHFYNISELGHGCQGAYTDSGALYNKKTCYIKGVKCKAEEAYFGGIVISTINA